MMKEIKQMYLTLKTNKELPSALLNYITKNKKGYNFGSSVAISYNDPDAFNIDKLKTISETEHFFAFVHSEKGKKFIKENEKQLNKAWTNMVLQNAGYGDKICKN